MSIWTRYRHWSNKFVVNMAPYISEFKDKPTNYLEIGVFIGNTSEWVLKNLLCHKDSRLVGIDLWDQQLAPKPIFDNSEEGNANWRIVMNNVNRIEKQYAPKVRWIKDYSQNVLPGWQSDNTKNHKFDIVYIDGHHTICSVLRDWVLSWPLLKCGGIMIFDDYGAKSSPSVRDSVDLILRGLDARPRILRRTTKYELLFKNNQVGIRKLKD
jgi:predicted O-methyltransferase YrrM